MFHINCVLFQENEKHRYNCKLCKSTSIISIRTNATSKTKNMEAEIILLFYFGILLNI